MKNEAAFDVKAEPTEEEVRAVTEAKRKKKRRRLIIDIILYAVAAALIVVGVVIIANESCMPASSAEDATAEFPDGPTPDWSQYGEDHDYTKTPVPSDPQQATEKPTPDPNATEAPVWTTDGPEDTPDPTEDPNEAGDPSQGGSGSGDPLRPVSIHFIDKGVNVAVQPVGYTSSGGMGTVGSATVAGWFKYSRHPNEDGNCIIAGHNRYNGKKGLFSIVKDLKRGDRIIVQMANGESAFYYVERIEYHNYLQVPGYVMEFGGERRLTLITCYGDYDHEQHTSRTRVVAICIPAEQP